MITLMTLVTLVTLRTRYQTAGGARLKTESTWRLNPQYLLSVARTQVVTIALSQTDVKLSYNTHGAFLDIGFYLIRHTNHPNKPNNPVGSENGMRCIGSENVRRRLESIDEADDVNVLHKGGFLTERVVSKEFTLTPGLTLIPLITL